MSDHDLADNPPVRASSNVVDMPTPRRHQATTGVLTAWTESRISRSEAGSEPDQSQTRAEVEFVAHDGQTHLRRMAATTVALEPSQVGRPVVLMFLDGDQDRPVITGVLDPAPVDATDTPQTGNNRVRAKRIEWSAEELVVQAGQELRLECGHGSLTITRDGRIVIRGTDVLSRASSTQRIRGGTVQLN